MSVKVGDYVTRKRGQKEGMVVGIIGGRANVFFFDIEMINRVGVANLKKLDKENEAWKASYLININKAQRVIRNNKWQIKQLES